jgi:hypothetical protein
MTANTIPGARICAGRSAARKSNRSTTIGTYLPSAPVSAVLDGITGQRGLSILEFIVSDRENIETSRAV